MGFVELDEVFDDGLPLPVNGKIYRVRGCDGATGLWCQRLMGAAVAVASGAERPPDIPTLDLDGDDEVALYRRLVGPAWDEMLTDGVSWPKMMLVGQTAFIWAGSGRTIAEEFWNSGGSDPKAILPNRAARRSASTRSTDGGATSKSSASMSGTKRQKAPSKSSTKAATRSRGKTS